MAWLYLASSWCFGLIILSKDFVAAANITTLASTTTTLDEELLTPVISNETSTSISPITTTIASLTTASTSKTKFGLAWLFSSVDDDKEEEEDEEDIRVLDDFRVGQTTLLLTASRDTTRVEVRAKRQQLQTEDDDDEVRKCRLKKKDDEESQEEEEEEEHQLRMPPRLEASEGDRIELQCVLQNVHHTVDLNRLRVDWTTVPLITAANTPNCNDTFFETLEAGIVPDCRIYTNFPFVDIKTSSKNISCSADLSLTNITVNNTGLYRCVAHIGFEQAGPTYDLTGQFHLRVSRRNDYEVHKATTIFISAVVVSLLAAVLIKKIMKIKFPWEKKYVNQEIYWPGMLTARRIASAGSLYHSKSSLRRHSEPNNAAIEDEDEIGGEKSPEDVEADKESMKEFKVIVEKSNFKPKSSLKKKKRPTSGADVQQIEEEEEPVVFTLA